MWYFITQRLIKMERLYIILTVLCLITSCSHDVIKDTSGKREICFEATVLTKGTMTTTDDLEKFYATAYSLSIDNPNQLDDLTDLNLFFENVEFERNGNAFYSYPAYYWPDVRSVIFVLWSPSLNDIGMEYYTGMLENDHGGFTLCLFKDVSPKLKISEQIDILYTLAVGTDGDNDDNNNDNGAYDGMLGMTNALGPVEFLHMLSSIKIQAKGMSGYTYHIKGIRIANVWGTANYLITGLNNYSNKTSYEELYDTPIEFSGEKVSVMPSETDYAFLLPQTLTAWNPNDPNSVGAYVAVLLHAEDVNGDVVYPESGGENDYQWSAIPISGEWDDATTYTYTLDFSEGGFGYPAPQN